MANIPFETLMTDRLVERSALEFENSIKKLHDAVASHSRVSVPWAPYEQLVTKTNISAVIQGVRKAYEARAMFATENPTWGPLPLGEECYPLLQAEGAMHMFGCFSFSLQLMGYDYLGHPPFHIFGCGVMAHPSAPE